MIHINISDEIQIFAEVFIYPVGSRVSVDLIAIMEFTVSRVNYVKEKASYWVDNAVGKQ